MNARSASLTKTVENWSLRRGEKRCAHLKKSHSAATGQADTLYPVSSIYWNMTWQIIGRLMTWQKIGWPVAT